MREEGLVLPSPSYQKFQILCKTQPIGRCRSRVPTADATFIACRTRTQSLGQVDLC